MRKHPAHGVLIIPNRPTIVYLTVCTKDRQPWLATPEVHALLRLVWTDAAAWLVGKYMIMPDHIHLFAAPDKWQSPLMIGCATGNPNSASSTVILHIVGKPTIGTGNCADWRAMRASGNTSVTTLCDMG